MAIPVTYYTAAERILVDNPETMDRICAHVGAGGALEDLCHAWNTEHKDAAGKVRFGAIWGWVCEDRDRFKRWLESHNVTAQADEARIKGVLRAIAFADIRGLFDAQGRVLPPDQWPMDLGRMVAGLDVAEMFDTEDGQKQLVGLLKKVKLSDRLKALELLGKYNGMDVQRIEHAGKVTMEQLVAGATEPPQS